MRDQRIHKILAAVAGAVVVLWSLRGAIERGAAHIVPTAAAPNDAACLPSQASAEHTSNPNSSLFISCSGFLE